MVRDEPGIHPDGMAGGGAAVSNPYRDGEAGYTGWIRGYEEGHRDGYEQGYKDAVTARSFPEEGTHTFKIAEETLEKLY